MDAYGFCHVYGYPVAGRDFADCMIQGWTLVPPWPIHCARSLR
jgi:hypothetical protein